MVKNRGGKVPTGYVGKLEPPPRTWRDDLPWGYGRRVKEIEGRWMFANSYSDAEAARDVAELVGILGAVQRELEDARHDFAEILPYAVCGCSDDITDDPCPVCAARNDDLGRAQQHLLDHRE